ncbi:MAG: hypothetical protein MK066_06235 [Crocinitomicaceae bacterium]|nr:hypothetical protein [Crocinitomicaceae bacterium]
MNSILKRTLIIYISLVLLLAILFFTIPIALFDGVIEFEDSVQSFMVKTPIPLSYFLGIGTGDMEAAGVKDFYLTMTGYILAFVLILGVPGLISYRYYLKVSRIGE